MTEISFLGEPTHLNRQEWKMLSKKKKKNVINFFYIIWT